MIKKIISYFISVKDEFFKYFAVGFSSFFLDIGTLILFVKFFNWSSVLSVVVNQVLLTAYGFILNKHWSFKNKSMPHVQFIKYSVLTILNYFFAIFVMYIFNSLLGFDYILVRVCTIVLAVSWNFFLYKYWVYADEKTSGKVDLPE